MKTISCKVNDLEYKFIIEYALKHNMTVSNFVRQVLCDKVGLSITFCPVTGKRILHHPSFSHHHNSIGIHL